MRLHRLAPLLVAVSIASWTATASAQRFVEDARIPAPSAAASFGRAIAMDGSLLAVGAPGDGAGAVLLYDVSTTSAPTLLATVGVMARGFGASVAVRGELVAIGAPDESIEGLVGCGAVYVFRRSGAMFSQVARLPCPALRDGARFGAAIAFATENGLAVGSPGASRVHYFDDVFVPATFSSISVPGSLGGGAVVATQGVVGGTDRPIVIAGSSSSTDTVDVVVWAPGLSAIVVPIENEAREPSFGASLAVDGPHVVIGAPTSDVAYVYGPSLDAMSATRIAELRAPVGGVALGASVAIRGTTVAIGATGLANPANADEGSVLVHEESLAFAVRRAIRRSDAPAGALGSAMAIDGSGTVLAVSAPGTVFLFTQREPMACVGDDDCNGERCIDGLCCDNKCGEGAPHDCIACDLSRAPGWCLPRLVGATCGPADGCEGRCDGESAECVLEPACELDAGAIDAGMSIDPNADASIPFDGGPPPPPGVSFGGGGGCRCAAAGAGGSGAGASLLVLVLAIAIRQRRWRS